LAANIDESRGKAAIFVVGEPAWHGKGKVLAHCLTAEQAIVESETDYTVEKWPLNAWHANGNLTRIDVPGWYATVRTDTNQVLGIVSDDYRVYQNREAFSFMDEAIKEGAAMWETAGALDGGRRVWMLARIPQELEVIKGDQVNPYALLAMGHDGGMGIRILPTTTRVVCQNTLNLALSQGKSLNIRHVQTLKDKIAAARRHLGLITQRIDEFGHQAQALAKVSLKETEVTSYFEKFYPTKTKPDFSDGAALLERITTAKQAGNDVMQALLAGHYAETERIAKRNKAILEQLLDNFESDPARGTAWGAVNAITQYADHQKKYESADSRLNSAWFGAGNELKQEAFSAALAMAV